MKWQWGYNMRLQHHCETSKIASIKRTIALTTSWGTTFIKFQSIGNHYFSWFFLTMIPKFQSTNFTLFQLVWLSRTLILKWNWSCTHAITVEMIQTIKWSSIPMSAVVRIPLDWWMNQRAVIQVSFNFKLCIRLCIDFIWNSIFSKMN